MLRRTKGLLAAALVLFMTVSGSCAAPPAPQQYILAQGTPMETRLTVLTAPEEGPCLFVIAGIHGDETAGWMAADALLEQLVPVRGSICILSPANAYGAQQDVRRTFDNRDLNRTFPGNPQGDGTQRLAHEIFGAVQDAQPVLVLDLHEALPKRDNRDYLGNSFIFTSMDGIEDLVFALLEQTGSGALGSEPFTYYDSAPVGSINYEVATTLGIPVITIETYREDPLETRIQNHIDLVTFTAAYYDIVSP